MPPAELSKPHMQSVHRVRHVSLWWEEAVSKLLQDLHFSGLPSVVKGSADNVWTSCAYTVRCTSQTRFHHDVANRRKTH